MDLIAMRFEARHLELDGKLQEALDVCRDILRHYASEPPTEQVLPVFVQASEISTRLGDRDGASALLLLAAERYAEAGLARPVIELYQRLRRLGPGRRGLDLQFARRMLEHRHPTAAREFLAHLARRQKKEKLLATLERMASWHDDKVQQTLLDFLDKAQGIRVSAAQTTPPSPAAPADAATAAPPAARAPEPPSAPRPPEPRARRPPPPPPSRSSAPRTGEVMPADAVVFVTPGPEPEPVHGSSRGTHTPIVPPRRRRHRRTLRGVGIAAALLLLVGAGAAYLVPRLRRAPPVPAVVAAEPNVVTAAELPPANPEPLAVVPESATVGAPPPPADSAPAAPPRPVETAAPGSAVPSATRRGEPPVTAGPPTAAQPVPVSQRVPPPSRPSADTGRPAAAPPPAPVAPPALASPAAAPAPAGPRVDYPVVIVEDLAITEITREGEPPAQRVVVKQVLPTGDTLDLSETDLGEGAVTAGAGRLLVRRHPSGGSMGTVRVGRFLVNARAPVEPEALERLLRRLVERN